MAGDINSLNLLVLIEPVNVCSLKKHAVIRKSYSKMEPEIALCQFLNSLRRHYIAAGSLMTSGIHDNKLDCPQAQINRCQPFGDHLGYRSSNKIPILVWARV